MIDLARCDDFVIGPVAVRPSSRELVTADGTVMVEPKVMQLLIVLARAEGRVVSRDALVEQCWPGRIVGDDAINRVVGKLRRVADGIGADVMRIETIARTGYRLVVSPAVDRPAATMPLAARSEPANRRTVWLAWAAVPVVAAVVALTLPLSLHRMPAAPKPPPATLPPAVTDLETRGLAAMFENTAEQTAEGVGYLREATAIAPRAAPVWGSLAMSYVLSLGWAPPPERAAVAMRVRDSAAHGLALDPRESRSAAALVSLLPTFGHWSAKEMSLAAATRRAHDDSGPLSFQTVQFLMAVGRTRAALDRIEHLARASPLVPWIRAAQIDLLAAAGRLDDADRAAEKARAIWPHDRLIWFTRFDLAAFNGQPDRALAMTADRPGWPRATTPAEIDRSAMIARALIAHEPQSTNVVLTALQRDVHDHGTAELALRVAAALGRPDIALATARQLYRGHLPAAPRTTALPLIGLPADNDPPTAALFLPPVASLATDPDFFALMTEIGLVDYWRQTGAPDLCAAAAKAACDARGLARRTAAARP